MLSLSKTLLQMWPGAKFADAIRKHWGGLVSSGALIGALSLWQSTGHIVKERLVPH